MVEKFHSPADDFNKVISGACRVISVTSNRFEKISGMS